MFMSNRTAVLLAGALAAGFAGADAGDFEGWGKPLIEPARIEATAPVPSEGNATIPAPTRATQEAVDEAGRSAASMTILAPATPTDESEVSIEELLRSWERDVTHRPVWR